MSVDVFMVRDARSRAPHHEGERPAKSCSSPWGLATCKARTLTMKTEFAGTTPLAACR